MTKLKIESDVESEGDPMEDLKQDPAMSEDEMSQDDPLNEFDLGDDEVVEEMDVFFSHEHAESLHLFQYPNRQPSDSLKFSKNLYKPLSRRFKMELPLDLDQLHFSPFQAEQLAMGMDDAGDQEYLPIKEETFQEPSIRSISLVSSEVPLTASYMIGQLKPGNCTTSRALIYRHRWIIFVAASPYPSV